MRYVETKEGAAALNALHRKYNTKRRYTAAEFVAIVDAVNPGTAIIHPVRDRNTYAFMEMLDSMLNATIAVDAKDLVAEQKRCQQIQLVGKFLLDIWPRVEKRTAPTSRYAAKQQWHRAIAR